MCTGIVETAQVNGSGKGPDGWFKLEQVNVSYDHPYDAQLEHALNIDFVNEKIGPGARVGTCTAIAAASGRASSSLPAAATRSRPCLIISARG